MNWCQRSCPPRPHPDSAFPTTLTLPTQIFVCSQIEHERTTARDVGVSESAAAATTHAEPAPPATGDETLGQLLEQLHDALVHQHAEDQVALAKAISTSRKRAPLRRSTGVLRAAHHAPPAAATLARDRIAAAAAFYATHTADLPWTQRLLVDTLQHEATSRLMALVAAVRGTGAVGRSVGRGRGRRRLTTAWVGMADDRDGRRRRRSGDSPASAAQSTGARHARRRRRRDGTRHHN